MKTLLKATLIAGGVFLFSGAYAQTHKDSTVGHKIGTTAKKVGHATSHAAASGAAAVVDKKYDGKVGPYGHTVYINNKSQYYYVNKKGHRVYITKAQMRDKPEK